MAKHADRRTRLILDRLDDRALPSGVNPVYSVTFDDAVTADNAYTANDGDRYYDIDSGADDYQTDVYERPTVQSYKVRTQADGTQRFAAAEYFANLDIVRARAGFDANFLYVSVELAGLDRRTADGESTAEGLVYRYGFRLATDPDGAGGFLVVADQPGLKNRSAAFGSAGTFIYLDADWDVGGTGRTVTKHDRPQEVGGNGYDTDFASDGRTPSEGRVLWARVNPATPTVVEFALAYKALGFTEDDLRSLPYLEVEANKGTQDPANYLWNDEYTPSESGSPYRATSGDRTRSVSGTQGLGNVYELDTLRGGAVVDARPASVSGYVFLDADADGTRDADEAGISGVAVTLTGTADTGAAVTREAVTGADGGYSFADLLAGTYEVAETQPAGYADGAESVGTVNGAVVGQAVANDRIGQIRLGAGEDGVEYNFGELTPATEGPSSLAGVVFVDFDADGRRGPGDLGFVPIEGVRVTLTGTDDLGAPVLLEALTNVDGAYRFDDLRPGTYTLTESQPAAYLDSGETVGTINGTPVGQNTENDVISQIVIGAGQDGIDYDFGELEPIIE